MKSSPRRSRASIYEHVARIGRAVAAPKRLEILDILAQGPRTVEVLTNLANGLTIANTSRHLNLLYQAGLVAREKKGLFVEYRLADPDVAELYGALRDLASRRLPAMDAIRESFYAERGALDPIGFDELTKSLKEGEISVIDVRPVEEFRAGHIAGARSIPLPELDARLAELPKRRPVAAYCRGPYCPMATDAVELLRERGYGAHRFDPGIVGWRSRGGAVETGA